MSHELLESRLAMQYEPTTVQGAIHAIVAISNALGRGDSHVTAHTPQSLTLESRHGYEGTVEERFGTFASREERCISCGDVSCNFNVERVE